VVEAQLLLVDDEPALLDLLKRYLERLGYAVEACSQAEVALARFASNPNGYALVVTDLTLDGISGEEMIERMRVIRPGLRAILSSGYPYHPRSADTVFLQKPYVPKILAGLIAKMLKKT